MGSFSSPRNRTSICFLLVSAFIFWSLAVVAAKDFWLENGKKQSSESIDLGRRGGMILANNLQNDVDTTGLDSGFTTAGFGIFDAFFASLSIIIVSEIGDETFIIEALMAMCHSKNKLRLLYIAWKSNSKSSQKKEMEEVEEKLENGQGKTSFRLFFSRFCTPTFLESFILTFLAEWGDCSQIATIALETHKNAVGVAVGATIGHTICTSLAVVGGSMLASKISQRTVATFGGLLFLGFSLSSYIFTLLYDYDFIDNLILYRASQCRSLQFSHY